MKSRLKGAKLTPEQNIQSPMYLNLKEMEAGRIPGNKNKITIFMTKSSN